MGYVTIIKSDSMLNKSRLLDCVHEAMQHNRAYIFAYHFMNKWGRYERQALLYPVRITTKHDLVTHCGTLPSNPKKMYPVLIEIGFSSPIRDSENVEKEAFHTAFAIITFGSAEYEIFDDLAMLDWDQEFR